MTVFEVCIATKLKDESHVVLGNNMDGEAHGSAKSPHKAIKSFQVNVQTRSL